jgi:hypothetical protein
MPPMPALIVPGRTIGAATVVSFVSKIGTVSRWLVSCSCGKERVVSSPIVLRGCACRECSRKVNRTNKKHGMEGTPTYQCWIDMRRRCADPTRESYVNYGGRGIKVCERWKKFGNFLADMGKKPPDKTLDRFPNNDGDYEPGNCRWATPKEQRANQRPRQKQLHNRGNHEVS